MRHCISPDSGEPYSRLAAVRHRKAKAIFVLLPRRWRRKVFRLGDRLPAPGHAAVVATASGASAPRSRLVNILAKPPCGLRPNVAARELVMRSQKQTFRRWFDRPLRANLGRSTACQPCPKAVVRSMRLPARTDRTGTARGGGKEAFPLQGAISRKSRHSRDGLTAFRKSNTITRVQSGGVGKAHYGTGGVLDRCSAGRPEILIFGMIK